MKNYFFKITLLAGLCFAFYVDAADVKIDVIAENEPSQIKLDKVDNKNLNQSNASLCYCSKKHSSRNITCTIACYSAAAIAGGFLGYVISAFIASSETPHTRFPTQQEHLAQLAIYQNYLGYYSSIIAPISAAVGLTGMSILHYCCCQENKNISKKTKPANEKSTVLKVNEPVTHT